MVNTNEPIKVKTLYDIFQSIWDRIKNFEKSKNFSKEWTDDDLRQSLINITNIHDTNLSVHSTELLWFTNYSYDNVPLSWKQNYIAIKYNKHHGGPDFILKNKRNDKKIGVEISEITHNVIEFTKPQTSLDTNYVKTALDKSIKVREGYTMNYYKRCIEICEEKIIKSIKYEKTDSLYLLLLCSAGMRDWQYFFIDIALNNCKKYRKKFNKILLI